MKKIPVLLFALVLLGCGESEPPETGMSATDEPAPQPEEALTDPAEAAEQADAALGRSPSERLETVLENQPPETKARYEHRHPQETLEFFGIEPGMTVVEALPGTGWYSRILVAYLGQNGRLIGANYAQDMWPLFGFFGEDFIEDMETWVTDWPQEADAWAGDRGAEVDAFEFGSLPVALEGKADGVLFIRALHNLARFESEGNYLTTALNEAYRVLKPGGMVGVVQHEARPETSDEFASGEHGYLKKEFVKERFAEAGFEFVDESDVNENPADEPTEADVVWRLPPTYMTSQDDPDVRIEMDAIGESNRMTLKFRKPEEGEAEEDDSAEE
jgi:predicted methyltransferase